MDELRGAAGGAVLGKNADDAACGELGPGEEPWQGADTDAGGYRFAQEEEVVAGGAALYGDLDDAFTLRAECCVLAGYDWRGLRLQFLASA